MLTTLALSFLILSVPGEAKTESPNIARVTKPVRQVRDQIRVGMTLEQVDRIMSIWEKCTFFMSANSLLVISGIHKVCISFELKHGMVTSFEKLP